MPASFKIHRDNLQIYRHTIKTPKFRKLKSLKRCKITIKRSVRYLITTNMR
ncbi:unnamed protein product [Moneuplotes crassus]|uniref:Uncharacterized protein n=1 Tax=Euplotes crassus TaxID=5936 RepID=A0AAD1UAN3_EUPCR|nr:unnamed protein product [Moneuplotes crassus]